MEEHVRPRTTLRDVSQPALTNPPESRQAYLARRAVLAGVRILGEHGTANLFATSSTNAGRLYRIDTVKRTCSCDGFWYRRECRHLALALEHFAFPVTSPAPIATPAAVKAIEPITCQQCKGQRGFKRQCGGYLSDWVWESCDVCNGTGHTSAAAHGPERSSTVEMTFEEAYAVVAGALAYVAHAKREERQKGITSWAVATDVERLNKIAGELNVRLQAIGRKAVQS